MKWFFEFPKAPEFLPGVRRAPAHSLPLTHAHTAAALKSALRYIPEAYHERLMPEFLEELTTYGHIYGYRFRPPGRIYGKPLSAYKGKTLEGKAFQLLLDNSLDFEVARYPYELITCGRAAGICSNWMQYRLLKHCLEEMTEEQTLVLASGQLPTLLPAHSHGPRILLINSPSADTDPPTGGDTPFPYSPAQANGWMHLGPQAAVQRIYHALMDAGRKGLGLKPEEDLKGKLMISGGLGETGGAQAKAIEIANGIGVIAEVDAAPIEARLAQGWIKLASGNLKEIFSVVNSYRESGEGISIAYHGNLVDLLAYVAEAHIPVDLLGGYTGFHEACEGGYCPHSLTFKEWSELLADPAQRASYAALAEKSRQKQALYIQALCQRGACFFGGGLLNADTGQIDAAAEQGFWTPGRRLLQWICLSGKPGDLRKTDKAAISSIAAARSIQDGDSRVWLRDAAKNRLAAGIQARCLYQDTAGFLRLAVKFNEMIRKGEVGPILLCREHGGDPPRLIQHFAGDIAMGMSLAALYSEPGGKAAHSSFGLALDGSERADSILRSAAAWAPSEA